MFYCITTAKYVSNYWFKSFPYYLMNKSKELIMHILKNRVKCNITEIVKLLYLIELMYYKNNDKQRLSEYKYIRYYYWPYDRKIIEDIENLEQEGIVSHDIITGSTGDEIIYYQLSEQGEEIKPTELTDDEIQIIDEYLTNLSGFRWTGLTKIAYGTKPMEAFQATLGWTEHFREELNFDAE